MATKHFLIAIALLISSIALANAGCNDCSGNKVQCFNETSFYMCYGETVDKSQILSCEEGSVCTALQIICAPKTDVSPVCSTGSCGNCDTNGFTCLSRSTFALCSNGAITSVKGKCQNDMICDSSSTSSDICVLPCKGTPTCDIADPVV